jgi:CheY-like chemotaxis protein
VVEDEALRLYTVEILTDLGYSVMAASNAAAALEIIGRDLLVATFASIPALSSSRRSKGYLSAKAVC